jgi:hypothetical protein
MNEISNCRGVLDKRRIKSVSVVTLIGIRLRMTILSGRMSWALARELSITKMFSSFSSSMAGSLSGKFNGIYFLLFYIQTAKLKIIFDMKK